MIIITCVLVIAGTYIIIRDDVFYILPAKIFELQHHNFENWTDINRNTRKM